MGEVIHPCFGVGLTLLLTKSELETRVDFLFRLLSFELGPHIKPLIPAREKHDERPKAAVTVKPHDASQLECPAGFTLKPAPQSAAQPAAPGEIPSARPVEPACVPIPPAHHSPLWGKPCYLAPLDGSESLRMGNIDSTGQYCEWDGVRLPLGAVIEPPHHMPHAQHARLPPSAVASQTTPAGSQSAPIPPVLPRVSASKTPLRSQGTARVATSSRSKIPPTAGGTAAPPPPGPDRVEHVTEVPRSVSGSPFASGFVDGAKESYQHLREVYQVIKKHGPGVVIPSREVVEEWVDEVKAQCLDRLDDCVRDKAKEAAQALNDFRQKPWEDKKYTLGHWSWSAVKVTAETAAIAVIPGGKATMRAGEKAAEEAALKGAAKAAQKKSTEDAAEHGAKLRPGRRRGKPRRPRSSTPLKRRQRAPLGLQRRTRRVPQERTQGGSLRKTRKILSIWPKRTNKREESAQAIWRRTSSSMPKQVPKGSPRPVQCAVRKCIRCEARTRNRGQANSFMAMLGRLTTSRLSETYKAAPWTAMYSHPSLPTLPTGT